MKKQQKNKNKPKNKKIARASVYAAPKRVNLAYSPYIALNVRSFFEEAQGLGGELNINYEMLLEDAYAIFKEDPTREGAEKAAECYVSVVEEACDNISNGLRELLVKWNVSKVQRKKHNLDTVIDTFETHMKMAIEDFRESFIENAVNGTMDAITLQSELFGEMVREALSA